MDKPTDLFSQYELEELKKICDHEVFLLHAGTACLRLTRNAIDKNRPSASERLKLLNRSLSTFNKAFTKMPPEVLIHLGMLVDDYNKYLDKSGEPLVINKQSWAYYRNTDKFARDEFLIDIKLLFTGGDEDYHHESIKIMGALAHVRMVKQWIIPVSTNPTGNTVRAIEIIIESAKRNAPEKRISIDAIQVIRDLVESNHIYTSLKINKEVEKVLGMISTKTT